MNVTERQIVGEARASQGQGLSALSVFVLFLFFSFLFTVVGEQGLK